MEGKSHGINGCKKPGRKKASPKTGFQPTILAIRLASPATAAECATAGKPAAVRDHRGSMRSETRSYSGKARPTIPSPAVPAPIVGRIPHREERIAKRTVE